MGSRVLLSTDIGSDIDDALSLLTILNSGIDLRGVYTVNGDVKSRAYIAKHMVDLARRKVTIATGESKSLCQRIEPYSHSEECFIDSSFIDDERSVGQANLKYLPLSRVGIIEDGIKDLINKLKEERHVIFSIAPLTNLARVLQNEPSVIGNIERLYAMGGRFPTGLEHNFRYDQDAAKFVLDSNIPITVVSANLCSKYRLPVELLKQLNSDVGKYVRSMAFGFLGIETASRFRRPLEEFDGYSLDQILEEVRARGKNLSSRELKELERRKQNLVVNLNDAYSGAFYEEKYFEQFRDLINLLKHNSGVFSYAYSAIKILESLPPIDVSIADVYVPYCFLYPEKLKVERANIDCSIDGVTRLNQGERHDIVVDLDLDHFREFVQTNLK